MKKYVLAIAAGIALVAAAIPAKAATDDGLLHTSPLDANAHMRGRGWHHGRHYGWHRGWHRGWYHHRHRGWGHHHRY